MLEADTLIRQNAVGSAFELAAHGNVGSGGSMVIDAGISLRIHSHAQLGFARPGNQDPQIGSKKHIGVFTNRVVGLKCTAIESHQEGAVQGVGNRVVLREVNAGSRAEVQLTAAFECDGHSLFPRRDFATVAQHGLPVRDIDSAGDFYFRRGSASDGLLRPQRRNKESETDSGYERTLKSTLQERARRRAMKFCHPWTHVRRQPGYWTCHSRPEKRNHKCRKFRTRFLPSSVSTLSG
jgi:hypothetical protein